MHGLAPLSRVLTINENVIRGIIIANKSKHNQFNYLTDGKFCKPQFEYNDKVGDNSRRAGGSDPILFYFY